MKSFYEKEEYSLQDIQSLIDNEVEESIYLDFKDSGALDKSDRKKFDISKDVSAFANSDGGIIVYGLKEINHKASAISYINGNDFTKEWLEQIINSNIQRRIPNILIYPIREENNIEKTVYLVKIPKSLEAPHLSKDKKFYKRFNFESVIMEEYEIRQSYGRKVKTELTIDKLSISVSNKIIPPEVLIVEVSVVNTGDILESSYKLNFYFNDIPQLDLNWGIEKTNYDHTRISNNRFKVSAVGIVPIFPDETVTVIRFKIQLSNAQTLTTLKNGTYDITLFYSNGEDTMSGDFATIMKDIIF